ncbi:MAG: hypothetical protein ACRDJH_20575 [Thermomicrobiales bacterium]
MILGQTQDRWGRTVELSESGWRHIARRHAEIIPDRALILATVAYPDLVKRDAENASRENFYRIIDWTLNGRPRRYLKVCVEYGETGGTIVTAFRCGNLKPGESHRWP